MANITIPNVLAFLVLAGTLASCSNQSTSVARRDAKQIDEMVRAPLDERVMTKAEQDALTPDQVLESLLEGNRKFRNNDITARDRSQQVRASALSQYPRAVILSCIDSRIPVEDVFNKGIGDLFVARVAGNFVNEDILGSMEFGAHVSGAKVIMVLGHKNCGAIKAAIDDVQLGNITPMLAKIKPAVAQSQQFEGERTSKNIEFVQHVGHNNVRYTVQQIRERSPILREMEQRGEIKIVGAFYSLETGEVTMLDEGIATGTN